MINFPQTEEKILKFWKDKDIFKKTLAKNSPKGPFSFYEGPPTANGRPGIHHVLARAFKDLIPRFKTMQGYVVERKAGWDTHGLPVELEVEKKLKISGKPEIEKFGIAKFNEECKKSVWQYQEEWEKLTERIGFWLDMKHPYVTYHNDYIESLWWIFKQINEAGYLYQGHKVVPQCPRCGTALSSHEVAQGYKSVTEPSVYLKFKVTKGNESVKTGDYILSWTTTPWTLPGNVALAVGEKFGYVRIKAKSEYYVLARERLSIINGEYNIEAEFVGSDLIGIEYEPLFPNAIPSSINNYQNAFKVYSADFVTTDDGTGVVHTAVMYGEDDYSLGDKVGLPKHHTVDENGKFVLANISQAPAEVKELYQTINQQFVKDEKIQQAITQNLQARGLLLKTENYTHDYPFCWRCDTPLLYYAKDSWFFKMSALREKLMAENEKINWIPEHIKEGRFGEWLSQVKDWAISRERYWGMPLPIWQCQKCKEIKVIGSFAELAELTGDKKINSDKFDPHRPFIDEYKLKCACGGEMPRVKEVVDCWFESGAMPFAQNHYPFENREKVDSPDYYPADFIAEAIDQTRGWFYTMLAVGVLLGKGTSYQNVICLGHINDAKGQKMSKHIGNVVDPWTVINQWGADALRFHLYTINQPGESKNFDLKNVESVVKNNFIILFNVLSFYKTYDEGRRKKEEGRNLESTPNHILDQWVIAKLNQLIIGVTKNLEAYNIFSAGRSISDFINDLSTWYLRRSRDRFKSNDLKDKENAVQTLGYVLMTLSKIMAPFTPFVADELYQQLNGQLESVHLEEWPEVKSEGRSKKEEVIDNMDIVRKIVELALAKRDEAGIKVRQPLQKLEVRRKKEEGLSSEYLELIKDEINVKEVVFKEGDDLTVELDININEELKLEGYYRELVRTVNQLRKEAGLTIHDQVMVYYQTTSPIIKETIKHYQADLQKSTISLGYEAGQAEGGIISKEVKVNEETVVFSLKK